MTGLVMVLAVGCSGSAVDSSCDVSGITSEVEHMVGESGLQLESLDALRCAGGWALARATVSGEGQPAQQSSFLFKETDTGWFLKDPAIACGSDAGLETVDERLKDDACSGT